ncbi:ElyC/SanA/YdcF family protein [Streptococcus loxodontisalivarius]|uniref:Uncharacterized SAM-binding protein YcdF (DUF218 family) n=1 Tax=Streptococcus loxodontisalivarius TaxID=1349415 RepID=A0ABS2PS12_9STRE|nr:ElyC/SanA/YdcF family protein [Streptococcus loxodontisalivarius]MBM7642834.1 uncharacterized SAM-binding protein YcdF (DUF218 family) [Streptococcus loxodontisalivarius]
MTRLEEAVKILSAFCGPRDIESLDAASLQASYGLDQVDVCVLFGGSILEGAVQFAQAVNNGLAKHYVIVGGYGHTTQGLIDQLPADFKGRKCSEAELLADYLDQYHGLKIDLLETKSTNCGNNITNLLELLEQEEIEFESILLIQDASMQKRMSATLAKYAPAKLIINYAAYQVDLHEKDSQLCYVQKPLGMWEIDRYLELLMGEIPRLRDDETGYGPAGQNFLAHVDIPDEVEDAFAYLLANSQAQVRQANSAYASK